MTINVSRRLLFLAHLKSSWLLVIIQRHQQVITIYQFYTDL